MGTRLKVGIQGKSSSTVTDLGILAKLLEDQTGISMTYVLEDNILLKMQRLTIVWIPSQLKNSKRNKQFYRTLD